MLAFRLSLFAVYKVRIPVEDWSTLRSNISIIYEEDLEGPISRYSQGHSQQYECKFSAKYACTFFAPALFTRPLFQTKYMASNGKMTDYQGCVLGKVHYPGRTSYHFWHTKFVNLLRSNLCNFLIP